MNSTYDYDPASRKDDIVDIVANVLNIIVPLVRPDVAITVGAFPWCESTYTSCLMFDHEPNLFQVLHLPSWFPGMSLKREMAIARELSKQYLDRPFAYALQKAVMIISIARLVWRLNSYTC